MPHSPSTFTYKKNKKAKGLPEGTWNSGEMVWPLWSGLVWSGLVDQHNIDQLTGKNVIFDILELPAFQIIASNHTIQPLDSMLTVG